MRRTFREECQTPEGEALRNDKKYAYASAWEFTGDGKKPKLNKEPLTFEYVKPRREVISNSKLLVISYWIGVEWREFKII